MHVDQRENGFGGAAANTSYHRTVRGLVLRLAFSQISSYCRGKKQARPCIAVLEGHGEKSPSSPRRVKNGQQFNQSTNYNDKTSVGREGQRRAGTERSFFFPGGRFESPDNLDTHLNA